MSAYHLKAAVDQHCAGRLLLAKSSLTLFQTHRRLCGQSRRLNQEFDADKTDQKLNLFLFL